jgi:spermidine/putrescine transport system substrate-binding protein
MIGVGMPDLSGTTRRRNFIQTAAAAGAIAVAGCVGGGSGDDKPDSLTYLSWGGSTQQAAREYFPEWTEETGIEIEHRSAAGDSEFISIIEQNPGGIDLFLPSSIGIARARERDLLAEVDYEKVPNYLDNMDEEWRDRPYIENDAFFRDALTQGISVNTDLTDREVTSFQDLKAEEYRDEMALRDAAVSRFTNCAQTLGLDVNDLPDNQDQYDKVVEELEAQHENVFGYWGAADQMVQWLQEERATVLEGFGGRTRSLIEEGMDQFEYIIPEEGTFTVTEDWAIPAGTNHIEWVYDLLNFCYQIDVGVGMAQIHGYPIAFEDPPKEIRNLPDFVEDPNRLAWVDWDKIIPVMDDWQREFERILQS